MSKRLRYVSNFSACEATHLAIDIVTCWFKSKCKGISCKMCLYYASHLMPFSTLITDTVIRVVNHQEALALIFALVLLYV